MSARPNLLKVWQETSHQLEAHLDYSDNSKDGLITESIRLKIPYACWEIEFSCLCKMRNGTVTEEYTKLRAPITNPNHFRFSLYEERLKDRIFKIIGLQDIIIGDEALDKRYIIQSSNEQHIKRLMEHDAVQAAFESPFIQHLRIIDDEVETRSPLPPQMDLLFGKTQHRMKSREEIMAHYDLFTTVLTTMEKLTLIDSHSKS